MATTATTAEATATNAVSPTSGNPTAVPTQSPNSDTLVVICLESTHSPLPRNPSIGSIEIVDLEEIETVETFEPIRPAALKSKGKSWANYLFATPRVPATLPLSLPEPESLQKHQQAFGVASPALSRWPSMASVDVPPHGNEQKVHRTMHRFGFDGVIVRGADLRHLPHRYGWTHFFHNYIERPMHYCPSNASTDDERYWHPDRLFREKQANWGHWHRADLIRRDAFGIDCYEVPYSIGKHNRWDLPEVFVQREADFQRPDYNISSVLFVSDYTNAADGYFDREFPIPPILDGRRYYQGRVDRHLRVKKMITYEKGESRVVEPATGRGRVPNILSPIQPPAGPRRLQPKHKKAARRWRRQQKEEKRDIYPEPEIRITYTVWTPRATVRQLNADKVKKNAARLNDSTYKRLGDRLHRSNKPQQRWIDEDAEYDPADVEAIDLFADSDQQWPGDDAGHLPEPSALRLTLADCWVEDRRSAEDYALIDESRLWELDYPQLWEEEFPQLGVC